MQASVNHEHCSSNSKRKGVGVGETQSSENPAVHFLHYRKGAQSWCIQRNPRQYSLPAKLVRLMEGGIRAPREVAGSGDTTVKQGRESQRKGACSKAGQGAEKPELACWRGRDRGVMERLGKS